MKLLLLGDTHFNQRGPERRKDDYFQTQLNKFVNALQIFRRESCDLFIQAGDFFDTPTVGNYVIRSIMDCLNTSGLHIPIRCIYGQHDIVGHTGATFNRSPLAILESSSYVKILSENPDMHNDVNIYGCSFGKDIPKVATDGFNVLVIHDMIGPEDLYHGQDITKPNSISKVFPKYDLIFCGDYHYAFDVTFKDRHVLNAGCMVRKTIGEKDLELKPSVIIYDTDKRSYEYVPLDYDSVEKVFDLSKEDKKEDDKFESLIEELKKTGETGVGWKKLLTIVYEKQSVSKDVINVIDNMIGELNIE